MSHDHSRTPGTTPELRMLWFPHLPEGGLSPAVLDEAMRRGRRERAEMLARLAAGLLGSARRGAAALLRAITLMQQRRARVALARNLMHPAVSGHQAAARGEIPGPVFQILSQPESRPEPQDSGRDAGDHPRLAA